MSPRIEVTKYPDAMKAMWTLISSHHVPDTLFARTREHFTEEE